jgi:hypothetical protein
VVREMWKCLQDNRGRNIRRMGFARKAGGSVKEIGDGKVIYAIQVCGILQGTERELHNLALELL